MSPNAAISYMGVTELSLPVATLSCPDQKQSEDQQTQTDPLEQTALEPPVEAMG
jgi:hypothetical protein